ncbi:NifX-associated nitrogen fixation protein [Mariprofundus ferrooxydans]|uniref:NifX-associated nitrogen fixation protein n=1 Tax=Mariprofundus ferrooxydans TaxID=314344 RepID=UPI00036EC437|nr:NifX-associated nitrogen fixation protein [Mariprofundus ferrooxydans]
MSNEEMVIAENDPALSTDFMKEMERQMRALDTYDTYDGLSIAAVLDPFILTKERRREIPVVGDPDEIVIARIKCLYNAISFLIEKETGKMATPVVNLSHEGFGRVLITVGKLVVLDRSLRDVHRFGFRSVEAMVAEGDKLLSTAIALIEKYPEAASE